MLVYLHVLVQVALLVLAAEGIGRLSVHFAHQENGSKLMPCRQEKIVLRHYESSTYQRWKAKWRLKATGIVEYTGNVNRSHQYQCFLEAFHLDNEDSLEALYRRLYLLDESWIFRLMESGAVIRR